MWCPWSSLEMRHGLTSANISKTILACVPWGTTMKRAESQETTSSNRRHVVIRSLRIPNVVLCFKPSKTRAGGTATSTEAPAHPFPVQESRSCLDFSSSVIVVSISYLTGQVTKQTFDFFPNWPYPSVNGSPSLQNSGVIPDTGVILSWAKLSSASEIDPETAGFYCPLW